MLGVGGQSGLENRTSNANYGRGNQGKFKGGKAENEKTFGLGNLTGFLMQGRRTKLALTLSETESVPKLRNSSKIWQI